LGSLAPFGQAAPPGRRLVGGVRGHVLARPFCGSRIDPGREVLGPQLGEGEREVPEVPLRVDGQHVHAIDGGFLDQADAEARLAVAGHADDDGVRGEVVGVVEQRLVGGGKRVRVHFAAAVEGAEFLEVHESSLSCRHRIRWREDARRAYHGDMTNDDSIALGVREVTLPGVGKKYVMPLRSGGNVAIVVKPDGDRQLFHFLRGDDRPCDVVKLDRDEAQQVANLMGGAMVAGPDLEKLELALGGMELEWVELPAGAPGVGQTLEGMALRRRTGASVVAVIRDDDAIANPNIDMPFEEDDTLLLVGTPAACEAAREILLSRA